MTVKMGVGSGAWIWKIAILLFGTATMAVADPAETFVWLPLPDYQKVAQIQLSLANPSTSASAQPMLLAIVPLTAALGLNQSATTRNSIAITGNMVPTNYSNYVNITGDDKIHLLSCDVDPQVNITPDMILDNLMARSPAPKAIVLYTQVGDSCGLNNADSLPYRSILTLASSSQARIALNQTAASNGTSQATISGNATTSTSSTDSSYGVGNSTVAMSILYSITGLITVLFLVIIATGAMRAHRNPERYGPQAGGDGRSRQSRAKGIARAVLETLPIVKFGEKNPKPDQAVELEEGSGGARDQPQTGDGHAATPPSQQTGAADATGVDDIAARDGNQATTTHETNAVAPVEDDSNLGCSICTEDFQAGEDVRVLPCDHKYHPACVDPWLVNVSGTCPLCRLDLRTGNRASVGSTATTSTNGALAPPLGAEAADEAGVGPPTAAAAATNTNRRRISRLLDSHSLRAASVEERIAALRRYRNEQRRNSQAPSQQGAGSVAAAAGVGATAHDLTSATPAERSGSAAAAAAAAATTNPSTAEEEQTRRARLATRLRDRFRVRTRPAPQ